MTTLVLMGLGALISDTLVIGLLAASPQLRRQVALRLLATVPEEPQAEEEEYLEEEEA